MWTSNRSVVTINGPSRSNGSLPQKQRGADGHTLRISRNANDGSLSSRTNASANSPQQEKSKLSSTIAEDGKLKYLLDAAESALEAGSTPSGRTKQMETELYAPMDTKTSPRAPKLEASKQRRIHYALSVLTNPNKQETSRIVQSGVKEAMRKRSQSIFNSLITNVDAKEKKSESNVGVGETSPASPRSNSGAFYSNSCCLDKSLTVEKQELLIKRKHRRKVKDTFPEKLMDVLSEDKFRHAITWLPSGQAFVVLDPATLVSDVLPRFFKVAKFESFTRKLNRWGFKRVFSKHKNEIVYYSKFFKRDKPALCALMRTKDEVDGDAVHHEVTLQTKQARKESLEPTSQAPLFESFDRRPSYILPGLSPLYPAASIVSRTDKQRAAANTSYFVKAGQNSQTILADTNFSPVPQFARRHWSYPAPEFAPGHLSTLHLPRDTL